MKRAFFAAALLLSAGLTVAPASADELSFYSSDGPMILDVQRDGRVHGRYRQDSGAYREGRIDGRVEGRDTITGLWSQQESDHPCSRPREGVQAWGQFVITEAFGRRPVGFWGYCGEQPNRPWNLKRQ